MLSTIGVSDHIMNMDEAKGVDNNVACNLMKLLPSPTGKRRFVYVYLYRYTFLPVCFTE